MKRFFSTLAVALGLLFGTFGIASAVSIFAVQQGGTGAGTFTAGLLGGSGTNVLFSNPTTTASCAGTASCSSFVILGSTPVTITGSGGSASFPFTTTTYGSLTVSATSTAIQDYPGLIAATSTIGALTASSSITNQSVKSALVLNSSTGLEGAYGGSNPCTNQVALSLSAAGVISCTSVTNAMLLNSSVTINTAYPLGGGGALSLGGSLSLTYAGLATSSPFSANQFVYTNNAGNFVTAASSTLSLPNTALQNSSITINTSGGTTGGGTVSLGGTLNLNSFAYPFPANATTTALTFSNGLTVNSGLTLGTALTIGNGGTNATSFTTSGNAVYYDGTRLATALTTAKITFPYASSTAIAISGELNAPHSGTVPTLAPGDVYVNTNSTASSSVSFANSGNHNLFAVHSVSGVLASSTLVYMGAFSATGSTTLTIANPLHASTLQSFFCKTDVGTAYLAFGNGSATTTRLQCTASGATASSLSNNTWGGRQNVMIEVGTSASSPNYITFTADVEDSN